MYVLESGGRKSIRSKIISNNEESQKAAPTSILGKRSRLSSEKIPTEKMDKASNPKAKAILKNESITISLVT